MFERHPSPDASTPPAQPEQPTQTAGAAEPVSLPAERVMRIAPMDLRQQRFKKALNGFDRTEVVAFLTEAAEDYESALREIDRLRQDLSRSESLLREHRDREANLRNTLLTAQKLADQVRESAHKEAELTLREAQGRADQLTESARREAEMTLRDAQGRSDLIVHKAQSRLEDIERDITELRLRRRGVEGTLETAIQTLYHALEFIKDQDRHVVDDKVVQHRPRGVEQPVQFPPEAHGAAPAPQHRLADERG